MFSKPELNFLLICVEEKRSENAQVVRNKAAMMLKITDLLEAPEEAPPEAKKPGKKKATKK